VPRPGVAAQKLKQKGKKMAKEKEEVEKTEEAVEAMAAEVGEKAEEVVEKEVVAKEEPADKTVSKTARKKVSGIEKIKKGQDLNKREVRQALHADVHNSRGRGRSPAEKRESYARYRENKKKVIDLESRNKQFLVLWPASDSDTNKDHKFYNMGGNSAIIYCYEIGPRIKRKPTLRRDMDNGTEKFHSGICSVQDVDKLTEKLAEIGIRRQKDFGDLVIFKLHREYLKTEIREMLKAEQAKLDALNKLLYSKVLYPDIHAQILELKRLIPAKVKNMDKTYREVVGMEMIRSMMELVKNYSQMAHGDVEPKVGAKAMMLETDMILEEISLFNELKIWEVSACSRVGSVVVGLRQLLKGKILNKEDEAV